MQAKVKSTVFNSNIKWDQPIFIIGNPRSGTSLFRIMLHSHSEVVIPPESHFFLWLEEKYNDWHINRIDDYLNDLYASTKFETWSLEKSELKPYILKNLPKDYAQLNSLTYIFFSEKMNKKIIYWGDKNKLWKEKLPTVHKLYPKAKFIHIVRDGRDIACSFRAIAAKKLTSKYAPKLPVDIESIANRWCLNVQTIEDFEKVVDQSNFLTIRYEDLLANTKLELEKTCDFLQVMFEDNMLNYYKEKSKEEIEPEEFFQWKEKLLTPPDVKNIGKFKEILSKKDIQIFNKIAKNELTQYKYN